MAILSSGVHIDTHLTNIAINYTDESSFWRQLCPNSMRVPSYDSWYPRFDANGYTTKDQRGELKAGIKTIPTMLQFDYTKVAVVLHGYEAGLFLSADELREYNAAGIRQVEEDNTIAVVQTLNYQQDLDACELLVNTGSWANAAVSAVWTDQTNGDPELDLRACRRNIQTATKGKVTPNTLVASTYVLDLMMMHTKVKARYDYVIADYETKKRELLRMLELDNIIEVRTIVDASKKGQTPVYSAKWGAFAWLGYIDPNPSRLKPTAIASLTPENLVGNRSGVLVSKISKDPFEDLRSGTKISGKLWAEIKQIAADCGRIITGIYT